MRPIWQRWGQKRRRALASTLIGLALQDMALELAEQRVIDASLNLVTLRERYGIDPYPVEDAP